MDRIDKCYNCKRKYDKPNGQMFCEIKNKVLYDGKQHTSDYYWCNGKYQQQIGKEGRSILEELTKKGWERF